MNNKTVYWYNIPFGGQVKVPIHANYPIVHFGMRQGTPTIWVQVYPDWPTDNYTRIFQIFGTGWSIPEQWHHVATLQNDGFVWHLYEKDINYRECDNA